MSLLLICEILGLLVNILTANDRCSLCYTESLQQTIQMHFSKKQKTFCQVFAAFMNSTSNFEDFFLKDDSHNLCISEIRNCKRFCYLNVQKQPFQRSH